ncbi:MAG: hypothetical protein AAFY17_00720, partial [Cyanobacteria bacterium J06642_11]
MTFTQSGAALSKIHGLWQWRSFSLIVPLTLLALLTSCQTAAPEETTPASDSQAINTDGDGSSPTVPPPPPENAYLAQLPPEVTNQLSGLAAAIVIPTYLPTTMKLVNHSVDEAAGTYYA